MTDGGVGGIDVGMGRWVVGVGERVVGMCGRGVGVGIVVGVGVEVRCVGVRGRKDLLTGVRFLRRSRRSISLAISASSSGVSCGSGSSSSMPQSLLLSTVFREPVDSLSSSSFSELWVALLRWVEGVERGMEVGVGRGGGEGSGEVKIGTGAAFPLRSMKAGVMYGV